ncbi:histidine phosphatase family protein [Nocardioides acrostichi]|uniref:Histidine phosphatase family protein n=1 Tax=Nocardioides acrostichi TaxID=2784339 RepID=A0A930V2A7_9ACTN|nr:histidine phosphatase family protein [Nocardioides acrostichi]MBF4161899.1 histidine phosphatase family protein [Nocardioides acrostichi]
MSGRQVWLVRHGETEWSRDGKHTGVTDISLTEDGERVAALLAPALAGVAFDQVLTSPRRRARRTAELAGFPDAEIADGLHEWDYGDYEGLTTPQIRESVPGWTVWSHPCPGGETAAEVSARLDALLARVASSERVLLVAHGHSLRALAARWLGLPVADGRLLRLDTATVSVLGLERDEHVLLRWNAPVGMGS